MKQNTLTIILLIVFIGLIFMKFIKNVQYIKALKPKESFLDSIVNNLTNEEYYLNFHKKLNELVYIKIDNKYLNCKGELDTEPTKFKIVLGLDNAVDISFYHKETNQYVYNNTSNNKLKCGQLNILNDTVRVSATFRVLYKNGKTYLQNNGKYLYSGLVPSFTDNEPRTEVELVSFTMNDLIEKFTSGLKPDKGEGNNRRKQTASHLLYHEYNSDSNSNLEKFEDLPQIKDLSGIYQGNNDKYFENVLDGYDTALYENHIDSKDLNNDNVIDYLKDMNSKLVNKNIEVQQYIDSMSMKIENELDKYGEYVELLKISKASNMYHQLDKM